jgi:ssDNA-binding Zn-finger/Zn-ribbon topoisomerase 1
MDDFYEGLKPLGTIKKCPKCGEEHISSSYFSTEDVGNPGHEYMSQRCTNCGYSWLELPLNIKPAEPDPSISLRNMHEEIDSLNRRWFQMNKHLSNAEMMQKGLIDQCDLAWVNKYRKIEG